MPRNYIDDSSAQTGISIVFSFLVIGDLIGNTLVIVIITRHKSMRTPMNYLLINLAISDMIVAVFIAPRYIFINFFDHPKGVQGTAICKLFTAGNLMWLGGAASVFSLVAVSFERYYAVLQPYTHKSKLSIKKVKTVVLVCWSCAFLLNIPLFIVSFFDEENEFCTEGWPSNASWLSFIYGFIWFIAAGILPVSTMVVLYSRVIQTLWFKNTSNDVESTQLAVVKSRKKVTKMVIIVSVIYPLCWLPYLFVYMLNYFLPGIKYGGITHASTVVLVACNSTINPFVYTYQNEKFKKHMNELLFKRCCGQNRVEASITSSSDKNSSSNNNEGHGNKTNEQSKQTNKTSKLQSTKNKGKNLGSIREEENTSSPANNGEQVTNELQGKTPAVGLKRKRNNEKKIPKDEEIMDRNSFTEKGSKNDEPSTLSKNSSNGQSKRKYSASLSSNGDYTDRSGHSYDGYGEKMKKESDLNTNRKENTT